MEQNSIHPSSREQYILRARVIEGSIPMPKVNRKQYKGLAVDNFEIFAPYTRENFQKLYQIGKDAWDHGDLSKFEILAWAGGANNHDGDRFLWAFRPDMYNFERIPKSILDGFETATPSKMEPERQKYYDRLWRPLPYAFSLRAYEDRTLGKKLPSLKDQMNNAQEKVDGHSSRKQLPHMPYGKTER